jgi:hypothetical protein
MKKNCKLRMPKSLLPSPRKIAQRGVYELMFCCGKDDYKPRNYENRLKKGKY